jgi:hypothetical protein
MVQIEMSGVVDTITGIFKTESNNAANVKGAMNTFAANANNKSYGTQPAPKPKESGFLNTITGLFASNNDSAINVRAKVMAMNKNANNKTYGKNTNNGWFSTIKQAFKSTSRPLNPNAPEYIPQSTAAMIQSSATQGGAASRRRRATRRVNGRRRN